GESDPAGMSNLLRVNWMDSRRLPSGEDIQSDLGMRGAGSTHHKYRRLIKAICAPKRRKAERQGRVQSRQVRLGRHVRRRPKQPRKVRAQRASHRFPSAGAIKVTLPAHATRDSGVRAPSYIVTTLAHYKKQHAHKVLFNVTFSLPPTPFRNVDRRL